MGLFNVFRPLTFPMNAMKTHIIAPGSEYYNEVHARWLPVPAFWVGQDARLFSDRIRIA